MGRRRGRTLVFLMGEERLYRVYVKSYVARFGRNGDRLRDGKEIFNLKFSTFKYLDATS